MGYKRVVRCKNCGKIYPSGIGEICGACGAKIATKNYFNDLLGFPCMEHTENIETTIAKRTLFGWKIKEDS